MGLNIQEIMKPGQQQEHDEKLPKQSLTAKIHSRVESKDKFFSLEYFPPRTPNGAVNLIARFDRMARGGPLFCDVTWHPAGDPSSDKETSSTTIAAISSNYCGIETMLHMTCANQSCGAVVQNLQKAKNLGLTNILALRGDPQTGDTWTCVDENLKYGCDMVRLVRKHFRDYFSICVAGYPQGHPEDVSPEENIINLKKKVDAGADFIITQLFFESSVFFKFVKDCRAAGITVPILPGVMPIQGYASLRQLVKLSKLEVPQHIVDAIEPIKNDDDAIRKFGVDYAIRMCRELLQSDEVPGIHFYTLNREIATKEILKALGLWQHYNVHRSLPWKQSAHSKRVREDVRPIFWATRPKSYIKRTSNWDEYPNGRWGNSASPSFSELTDHYLFCQRSRKNANELRAMWGEKLESVEDVCSIFEAFLTGKENTQGNKVKALPFNDDEIQIETNELLENLLVANKNGFLTINSQPNVNGAKSTDEKYGWGGPGGYVYQKAYLEFFMHKNVLQSLLDVLSVHPGVSYHVIDHSGVVDRSNGSKYSPIAVTWGVFPGKEIMQPTVVDPISFKYWKDEAYSLWLNQWQSLYDDESQSWSVIQNIHDNFYLVTLVDNDFVEGNCLFDILRDVITKAGSVIPALLNGKDGVPVTATVDKNDFDTCTEKPAYVIADLLSKSPEQNHVPMQA